MEDGGPHKNKKILMNVYVSLIRVWNYWSPFINSLM